MSELRIATGRCTDASADDVVERLVEPVRAALGGRTIDLAIVFASPHFRMRIEPLALELHEALNPHGMIGTLGEAVIHDDAELENQPGIVLWAAHLPGAAIRTFHLSHADQTRLQDPQALAEHLDVPNEKNPAFLLAGDPYSIDLLNLLDVWTRAYPKRPMVGGMASAGQRPGQNSVIFDGQCLWHGVAGVAVWGSVRMDTIVSQGCRPIGQPLVITRGEEQMVYSLGGRTPRDVFEELFHECDPRDRELMEKQGLFLGRVINEYQPSFARGDFLIRNVLGFDRESGAMAVHDLIRTGQTVQFHVRDARTADEDLRDLLTARRNRPAGGLLFTCNGRGRRLFGEPHHDAAALRAAHEGLPVAGFFCAGEIGPVGHCNYLHGHTASIALFTDDEAPGGDERSDQDER